MKPSGYSYVFILLCALSLSVMAYIVFYLNGMNFSGETPERGVARLIKKSKARAQKIKMQAKRTVKKSPRKKEKTVY